MTTRLQEQQVRVLVAHNIHSAAKAEQLELVQEWAQVQAPHCIPAETIASC